jgi:hypothetical protein
LANPIVLSEITTPDKAADLFTKRRSEGAKVNRQFYDGDHLQEFAGYMGQIPPAGIAYRSQTLKEIESGFISENVIRELVDRHIAGNLGRECVWGFLPADIPTQNSTRIRRLFSKLVNAVLPNQSTSQPATDPDATEADEATTQWWDKRRVRNNLKDALRGALLDDSVTLNFFFPPGTRDATGQIPKASDLVSGLMVPRLRILSSDKAGVFIDEDTEEEFGVYSYTNRDEKKCAEITYVDASGLTILTVLTEGQARRDFAFELGGRLLMYELRREPLITEQIRSTQKALNLNLTSMMRNVNLAGNLERTVFNAERPKRTVRVNDDSALGYHEEIRDAEYETGAGATMFLAGLLIRNDDGEVVGRANPNISFRQPVDVATFIKTRADLREAMHGQAQQLHIMISGDATASGRSREQARAEFKSSLMLSKEVIDDAGRWATETGVRLGAQLCGQTAKFINLRCEFNSIIDDGPVDVLDRQENRKDVEAGLLSIETAMSRNAVEDTDGELERIRTEKAEAPEPSPSPIPTVQPPVNGDTEIVQ